MNSEIYIEEVLKPLGVPFYERCVAKSGLIIWIDDGAAYHTSKKVLDFGREVGLLRIKWPAQSPDLNPIENLWRIIKIRFSARRHQIHSVEAMTEELVNEWDKLTARDFQKCIASMPKRCHMVIKAQGGGPLNTDYII